MQQRIAAIPEPQVRSETERRVEALLHVNRWPRPGAEMQPADHTAQPEAQDDAPWWWDGDEDASQSFLTSMGVHLG